MISINCFLFVRIKIAQYCHTKFVSGLWSHRSSNCWYTVYFHVDSITVHKVGKSKHSKTLLRYKESKGRQHVSALLFFKAIISSDMVN